MKRSLALVFAALFGLLLALPASGARFTDTTTNAGNTFVFGGAPQPIRVTTYRVDFTGQYHTLVLNHELAEDYFVLLRGSTDTAGLFDEDENPLAASAASDYVRVVGDPSGRPGDTTAGNAIELGRFSDVGTWWGQVTVVESVSQQETAGFRLRNVHRASMTGNTWSAVGSWVDATRVALYGGSMGGGMTVDGPDHANGWARIWPNGDSLHLERAVSTSPTNFTIYEVEWGSEWTIQHAHVTGNAGGSGVDTPNEYDTAQLVIPVLRSQSFVLAYGFTDGSAPGTGWEGQIYALGNGHPVNSKENKDAKPVKEVAVGSEYRVTRDVEVYVHSHPLLHVDHRSGPTGSLAAEQGGGSLAVDPPLAPETYWSTGDQASTGTLRFSVLSNSSTGSDVTGTQPIVWSRHTSSGLVSWARHETAESGAYWLQSVDFGEIWR